MSTNRYIDFSGETERLSIRAWRLEDAESAFEMYGDPRVAKYLSGIPETSVESQLETLQRIIASYSKMGIGYGSFPFIEKATGNLIGAVLLKPLPRTDELDQWRAFRDNPDQLPPIHEIEIGWHVKYNQWGKGFATEAARTMMDVGFRDFELDEIHAVLYKENTASRNVAEKLGMSYIGSTDKFYGVEVEHFIKTKSAHLF